MVMRIAELRKSECCPVIGQIEVALPLGDHITSLETEPTSRWYSNSRTFAEPINEATQMTTAQAVGAASHTSGGWYPLPCELAASLYRVALICTWNGAASSFFMGALLSARAGSSGIGPDVREQD